MTMVHVDEDELQLVESSPLFDARWYLSQYEDARLDAISPAMHYLKYGVEQGKDPSPNFNTRFYLLRHADVAAARIQPLIHYIRQGAAEGRETILKNSRKKEVLDAKIYCIKETRMANKKAIFVTHSSDGNIRPHVQHYLRGLTHNGVSTNLVISSNAPEINLSSIDIEHINGIFVRENTGYDFAAWAHLLRLDKTLTDADQLFLLNDSLFGPLNNALFENLLQIIDDSECDFAGLTDNYQVNWHAQSFFLVFKRSALNNEAFMNFFLNVESYEEKDAVILEYETKLAPTLLNAGLACAIVFPAQERSTTNRTLANWKDLIEEGMPFVKVAAIRDEHAAHNDAEWRHILASRGYDLTLVDRTLSQSHSPVSVGTSQTALKADRLPIAEVAPFSAAFYIAAYPDVEMAGVDPHDHFLRHGKAEGRLGGVPLLEHDFGSNALEMSLGTVLLISHEGERSGCPILTYNIANILKSSYRVVVLFLGPGPMIDACYKSGLVAVGPISITKHNRLSQYLIARLVEKFNISFAIGNSVETRHLFPALAKCGIPVIALIHEFASYIRPFGAFYDAVKWATATVFSTNLTRIDAINKYPELERCQMPVIPQGRCHPVMLQRELDPNPSFSTHSQIEIKDVLRPANFDSGFVVIGVGRVEYRKGVDIFISVAERVSRLIPSIPLRFVWIGRGYDPQHDPSYSSYLHDQIDRSKLCSVVHFAGETVEMDTVYRFADLLLLTSRLDPLPNVAIEALDTGLPVLCFDKTTGIADLLEQDGLAANTVAGYLDIEDMARKITALAISKPSRDLLSVQSRALSKKYFNMENYVSEIERIALAARIVEDQQRKDFLVIAGSKLFRIDYFSIDGTEDSIDDSVLSYMKGVKSGLSVRKPFPGFHPLIFQELCLGPNSIIDPLAEFIRRGMPVGPWSVEVITPTAGVLPARHRSNVALHIHCFYIEKFFEIIERISSNRQKVDIFVSVVDRVAENTVIDVLKQAGIRNFDVRIVPNRGRDVGPFLTEFAPELVLKYDIIGHVHTKRSVHTSAENVGQRWFKFLLENLIGGSYRMMDLIIERMAQRDQIGVVFPDDPHAIGWDGNRKHLTEMGIELPVSNSEGIWFPIGTMFWARADVVKAMVDFNLQWEDYPDEPVPYNGSILHALERTVGVLAAELGYEIVTTNVPGVTR